MEIQKFYHQNQLCIVVSSLVLWWLFNRHTDRQNNHEKAKQELIISRSAELAVKNY